MQLLSNKKKILWCLMVLLSIEQKIFAQGTKTQADTLTAETKSPKGALVRSALIPGWGQWYNENKWKAVLVLGTEMVLIGNVIFQDRMARQSKTTWERDYYLNNRNQFTWWYFGVYLLNLLDAYVDAHLWNFDTGPDLKFVPTMDGPRYVGITFTLPIDYK